MKIVFRICELSNCQTLMDFPRNKSRILGVTIWPLTSDSVPRALYTFRGSQFRAALIGCEIQSRSLLGGELSSTSTRQHGSTYNKKENGKLYWTLLFLHLVTFTGTGEAAGPTS